MSILDYIIFFIYMSLVFGVGVYFFRKNEDSTDYFLANRDLHYTHVGLSIAATDVGGGFSIGLGGLGFTMGLSGSWLLFSGLIGAWLSAVFIIPKIKKIDKRENFYTFPDFLSFKYNKKVAIIAAVISGIGYIGFTGAQILAGATLASQTIFADISTGISPLKFSILLISVITIGYTVLGGLKAVIYTDTIQWIILIIGLIFVTIPAAIYKLGGLSEIKASLPPGYFSLTNITPIKFINWMITIIPIWVIGMTLYQRMFACRNEKEAKKAWYIAGLFEYPVMAFTGVFLGMCGRVIFPLVQPEMGIPLMIRYALPVGVTGIIVAAYFSVIMSTADSCLIAASGHFVNDLVARTPEKRKSDKTMKLSLLFTLGLGVFAVILALSFSNVLNAMLYTYSFMVSGLFIPTLGAYFWKKSGSTGAIAGMLGGGTVTVLLLTEVVKLPSFLESTGLHPTFYGILTSLVLFFTGSILFPDKK
ncbi:MAG: sodium:solute symporter family protein [Myxococcota bacterium]